MMKKYILVLMLSCFCFPLMAQSYKNSKFLYGKAKSNNPFYLSLQLGMNTGYTFFNNDYQKYGHAFSAGLSFQKPLDYRWTLMANLRMLGNYDAERINLHSSLETIQSINTRYQMKNSFDLSAGISYLVLDWRSWQTRAGVSLGFVQNAGELYVSDSLTQTFNPKASGVIPLQISTGRVIKKRWEIELGYRYYLGLASDINPVPPVRNDRNDKYSFYYAGIKYRFGELDYRFMKKGSCPPAAN